MMRYVDVIAVHDGSEGPAGAPRSCIEHDGDRALARGVVRMTVEEYREAQRAWDEAYARWSANRPLPPPPEPALPDALPAWACKAALDEADMLRFIKAAVADAAPAVRWRFDAAATWHRPDIEAMGERFGISAEMRKQLWARAAEIAEG